MEESVSILIDQIPLGIIMYSRDGKVEYINKNFHKFGILYHFDYPLQEINLFEFNLFRNSDIIHDLKNIIKGIPFEKEIKRTETRSGGYISLFVKGFPVYEEENISGGMLIVEDLKILAETDKELKLKSKLTEDYLERSEDFIIVTDTSGDIKFSAGKDNARLKLFRKEITGKNIGDVFNSTTKQKILDGFSIAVRQRKAQLLHLEIRSEDTYRLTDCKIDPVVGDSGYIQFLYLIFKEIPTKKPKVISKFPEFNELNFYKELAKKNNIALILVSKNGEVIYQDELLQSLTGSIKENEGNQLISDIFPLITQNEFKNILAELNINKKFEFETTVDKNIEGQIPLNLTFFSSEDNRSIVSIVCERRIDNSVTTEKKKTEFVESITSYEVSSVPIIQIDSKGSILLANQSLKSLLNFPDIELYGKKILELIKSDEHVNLKDEIASLKIGEKKNFPIKIKNYTGDEIQTNLTLQVEQAVNDLPHIVSCTLSRSYEIEKKVLPESIYKSLFTASQYGIAVELNGKISSGK